MRIVSIQVATGARGRDLAIGAFVEGLSRLTGLAIEDVSGTPRGRETVWPLAFGLGLALHAADLPPADVYIVHSVVALTALRDSPILRRVLYPLHVSTLFIDRTFGGPPLGWRLLRRGFLATEERLLRRVPLVVAMSEAVARDYRARGVEVRLLGAPLFPPAAVPRAEARARLGLPADAPVLLFVGRLAREKRPELAVEVACRLGARLGRPPILLVAGRGGLRPRLERLARAVRGRADVRLLGNVPRPELGTAYGAADLLLVPSDFEATHFASVEAALLGTAVVGRPVGEVPRIAAACAADAEGLAAAAARVLAEGPGAGEACRARARELYDPERWRQPWLQALREVAG